MFTSQQFKSIASLPNSLIDIKDEANSAIKYVDMARCRSAPATKSPTKRATDIHPGRRGKAAEPWYCWILIASVMFAAVGWEIFRLMLTIMTLD